MLFSEIPSYLVESNLYEELLGGYDGVDFELGEDVLVPPECESVSSLEDFEKMFKIYGFWGIKAYPDKYPVDFMKYIDNNRYEVLNYLYSLDNSQAKLLIKEIISDLDVNFKYTLNLVGYVKLEHTLRKNNIGIDGKMYNLSFSINSRTVKHDFLSSTLFIASNDYLVLTDYGILFDNKSNLFINMLDKIIENISKGKNFNISLNEKLGGIPLFNIYNNEILFNDTRISINRKNIINTFTSLKNSLLNIINT